MPMRISSTGAGCTSLPSAATTIIFSPGMRTSMNDMALALMSRSRTFSPLANRK